MTLPFSNPVPAEKLSPVPEQPFAFRNSNRLICAKGPVQQIARGPSTTIGDRVAGFFAGPKDGAIMGGALPFDNSAEDYLWHAKDAEGTWLPDMKRPAPVIPATAAAAPRSEPLARDYMQMVSRALDILRAEEKRPDGLSKIVLARTLLLQQPQNIILADVLQQLAEDTSVTAFQVALPPRAGDVAPRALVGATPELLLRKRGAAISSHPLAGSAKRLEDSTADAAAAHDLSRSDKDRHEHALVVEYILDTLAPYCHQLGAPDGTTLTTTRSMWHIGTFIEGILKDPETPAIVLASLLHPTPAVCGLPCQRSADLIRDLEPVSRDFYAGAVGWCDRQGDGAWYVAIRCAEICGAQARLYAGAGIVLGSEPYAEAAETGAKFGALLAAFGLPRDAALHELEQL
ncbi:isochorismate synthase MenF [Falsirhodobacter sp. alg1]|uniref:isochorismate synthase n=1 Tax=Falsirhodobacter sp. alg1 TaxID=1472418 RepID=UPI000788B2D9|nr:isochorismate synthase [Falsirhodobacter sp. alg1]